jgi:hypothetical protein
MLTRRNDPRVKSVLDLSIDFSDLNGNGNTTEHLSYFMINANGDVAQRARPGVTPNVGVPATPNGLTLDTQGEANHLFRMQSIREIVARIMADNNLDALVYPYSTLPAKILTGTRDSIAWLSYDGRPNRGYNSFTDASGLPAISVPAGYTNVVYDRTTRGSSEEVALNPPAVKRDVTLPFSIVFLGRLWSEPTLLEIASAYEHFRGPRTPPADFGIASPAFMANASSTPSRDELPVDTEATLRHDSDSATPSLTNTLDVVGENERLEPSTLRSGSIYAEVNGSITTGITVVNPNASPVTVNFSLPGMTGDSGFASVVIPANGQLSKFLHEDPFNIRNSFQSLLSFRANAPVAVSTLRGLTNERNEFLATALPLIEDSAENGLAYLPQFAAGDGWTTELILVNPSDSVMTGTVQFVNADGGLANVSVAGGVDSTFAYSIPKRAAQKLVISGGGYASRGSTRVIPAENGTVPRAFAVLSQRSDGVTVSEVTLRAITANSTQ